MANVVEYSIKAIDDFSATMNKMSEQTGKIEKALIAAGVAGAFWASIRMVQQSLATAEAMGVAAQKANMSAESYSALAWAAKMSNVEAGILAAGMRLLGRAMAEGDATPAGLALAGLGIAAKETNGEMRPTIDVLMDVADAFQSTKDDANKTKVAMELFGRGGVEMVPMLNQGSAAMKAMMTDAEKLGIVISGDFAKSADQINDNLATLSDTVQGSVNKAMTQLAPTIELITGQFVELASEEGNVEAAGNAMATGLKVILSAGTILFAVFKSIGEVLGGTVAAIVQVVSGDFSGALSTVKNVTVDLGKTIGETAAKVTTQWDGSAQAAAASASKQAHAAHVASESMNAAAEQQKKAADELKKADDARLKSISDTINELEKSAATTGMTAGQTKMYELTLQGATGAQLASAAAAVTATEAFESHNAAMAAAKSLIEGQQSPLEQHQAKLEKINELKREGALTTDQQTEAIKRENTAWEEQRVKLDEYKQSVTDVMGEASRIMVEKFSEAGSAAYQTAALIASATQQLIKGIGDSVASAIMDGTNLGKALENVVRNVVKNIISMLIQIGIQRLILSLITRTTAATEASANMAAALGSVYLNSFASAAAIPFIGWSIAPGIAAANTTIAGAGAVTSMATGAGIGMMAGAAHGGLDYVPAEATYLLDKGERVLSPRQNEDLTGFMQSGVGGGMSIGNLTIHILENATNADAFARMDRVQLRNTLGQPVIDALNEMFSIGVRPNFATQAGR